MATPLDARLWLCADLGALPEDVLAVRVRAVLARVPACVWLRPTMETTARSLRDLATGLIDLAHASGGSVIVGERLDVAVAAGADGVHLGARAIPPHEARRFLSAQSETPCRFVSGAAHDAYAVRSRARDCDALVVSPFRAVPGKGEPLGMAGLACLVAQAPARSFVALGGILTEADASDAARSGVRAIAVRRALVEDPEPAEACARLHDAFVSALDPRARW